MKGTALTGLVGTSPLGFMAALGLLRVLDRRDKKARLRFLTDGSFAAFIESAEEDLPALVAHDAELAAQERGWRLEYEKKEKNRTTVVADLKPPPAVFAQFLERSTVEWIAGNIDPAGYAAAFGTSIVLDNKGNTKPTAFHFTAGQQQFLAVVELIRKMVTSDWVRQSLFEGAAARAGSNLRWDPGSDRNWALMASKPANEDTNVDAPAEWLAFRALPLFPCAPSGSRVLTTGVQGRGKDMTLSWPLWSVPISVTTAQSALRMTWTGPSRDRLARGVFATCTSVIRRTTQGYGNFGPATVAT
jgi:hypothetical protein